MIEVQISSNGEPLARIEIERIGTREEFADYKVKYAVERGSAVSVHDRTLYGFPRKYYNAFGLVLQSLNALNEKDLKLEKDFDINGTQVNNPTTNFFPRMLERIRKPHE